MSARRPDAGILGPRHPRVQRLRRLLGRRSARQAERVFVIEGSKVLVEALDAGVAIESVYLAAGAHDAAVERAVEQGAPLFELGPGVMERVADTVTPQPVMAVVHHLDVGLPSLGRSGFVVVAVDLRDPGNAGTVLRSAEASGAAGVVYCGDTVDVYSPKTVRASAGALFHIPIVVSEDPVAVVRDLSMGGMACLGTTANGGTPYSETDLTVPLAFVLGNESRGLPRALEQLLTGMVTIPMYGRTESLNVGMAAAVLCFEAARQRRTARTPDAMASK